MFCAACSPGSIVVTPERNASSAALTAGVKPRTPALICSATSPIRTVSPERPMAVRRRPIAEAAAVSGPAFSKANSVLPIM